MIKFYTKKKLDNIKKEEYNKGYNQGEHDQKEKFKEERNNLNAAYNVLEDKYNDAVEMKEFIERTKNEEIKNLKEQITPFELFLEEHNIGSIEQFNELIISFNTSIKEFAIQEESYKKQLKNLKTSNSLYKTNKIKHDKNVADLINNLKKYGFKVEKGENGVFNITAPIQKKNPGHLYDGPKKDVDKYIKEGKKIGEQWPQGESTHIKTNISEDKNDIETINIVTDELHAEDLVKVHQESKNESIDPFEIYESKSNSSKNDEITTIKSDQAVKAVDTATDTVLSVKEKNSSSKTKKNKAKKKFSRKK